MKNNSAKEDRLIKSQTSRHSCKSRGPYHFIKTKFLLSLE
jgi:hypothetical protein